MVMGIMMFIAAIRFRVGLVITTFFLCTLLEYIFERIALAPLAHRCFRYAVGGNGKAWRFGGFWSCDE
jgi:hypothetical protein